MVFTTRAETLPFVKCLIMGTSEWISFFALLKHYTFAFSIKLSLSQPMSILSFLLFSPIPLEMGVNKMLGWCTAVGWGQPTTAAVNLNDSMILWYFFMCIFHIFYRLKKILNEAQKLPTKKSGLSQVSEGFFFFMWKAWEILGWPVLKEDHRSTAMKKLYIDPPIPSINIHLKVKRERSNLKEVGAKLRRMIRWHTTL